MYYDGGTYQWAEIDEEAPPAADDPEWRQWGGPRRVAIPRDSSGPWRGVGARDAEAISKDTRGEVETTSMDMSKAEIGARFVRYLGYWVKGSQEDLAELYDEIEGSEQSDFPYEPALAALAELDGRKLWKAFGQEELQDLYDWSQEAGLPDAAERFMAAEQARPYIDDGKIPTDVRALVVKRDGERCQNCGSGDDLTIDHKITPWSLGGSSTDPANLQVLCRACNSRKGARNFDDEAR